MNILIVEDSLRLRDSLGRGLGVSGFAVDTAANGLTACQHLDTYKMPLWILRFQTPELL